MAKTILDDEEILTRIEVNPKIMVGKPVIKGTRLTVQFVLGLLANGMSIEDIRGEYEGLTREDILACLSFAAQALGQASFMPLDNEVA